MNWWNSANALAVLRDQYAPGEETKRLVFADAVEDCGDSDYAAFVRHSAVCGFKFWSNTNPHPPSDDSDLARAVNIYLDSQPRYGYPDSAFHPLHGLQGVDLFNIYWDLGIPTGCIVEHGDAFVGRGDILIPRLGCRGITFRRSAPKMASDGPFVWLKADPKRMAITTEEANAGGDWTPSGMNQSRPCPPVLVLLRKRWPGVGFFMSNGSHW